MFKNSDDELTFSGIVAAYRQEFGTENLIVFLPNRVRNELNEDLVFEPMTIKFWKKNLYSIRVKELTAGFDLPPDD